MPYADPEQKRANDRAYYLRRKGTEELRAQSRAISARYRARHPERVALYRREYQQATREERRAYGVRYRAENIAAIQERRVRYYEKNKEAEHVKYREWVLANRIRRTYSENLRRARQAQAVGSHTLEEWEALALAAGGRCHYCGSGAPLTRDHLIPLSRGGSDDISNIVPACGPCNSGKKDRTVEEFRLLRNGRR